MMLRLNTRRIYATETKRRSTKSDKALVYEKARAMVYKYAEELAHHAAAAARAEAERAANDAIISTIMGWLR
jgi:membrane protein involved in colicin uptake